MIGNHIYIYIYNIETSFPDARKIVIADFKVSSASYLLKPLVLTGHHLKFLSCVQNNQLIFCLLFLTCVLVLTRSLYVGKFELMLAVIKVCDKLTVLVKDFFDLLQFAYWKTGIEDVILFTLNYSIYSHLETSGNAD